MLPNATSDGLVDDLLPEDLDWASWVREHPLPALLLAGVGGFLVGRLHGDKIVDSASDLLNDRVQHTVERLRERTSLE